MTLINIVTAVSRPANLPRIHSSMEAALAVCPMPVRWILVFDEGAELPSCVEAFLTASSGVTIHKAVYPGGPMKFGIPQKNLGIDLIEEGFYHCLDDDNIVHPDFFIGLSRLMTAWPSKLAFVFSQTRWDGHGNLKADPSRMKPGYIDNTMFVVHKQLIGSKRYEFSRAGIEDGYFFSELYERHPDKFEFCPDFMAYYNYLRHYS